MLSVTPGGVVWNPIYYATFSDEGLHTYDNIHHHKMNVLYYSHIVPKSENEMRYNSEERVWSWFIIHETLGRFDQL